SSRSAMQNLDQLQSSDPRLTAYRRCFVVSATVAGLTSSLPLWLAGRRLHRRVTEPEWPGRRLHLTGWQRRTIAAWVAPVGLAAFIGSSWLIFHQLRRRCRMGFYGVGSLAEADAAHCAWEAERQAELDRRVAQTRQMLRDRQAEKLREMRLMAPPAADGQDGRAGRDAGA
ncbi:hypothetical protein BOX15_Mlig013477g2, partial [Macrostomum lignano]